MCVTPLGTVTLGLSFGDERAAAGDDFAGDEDAAEGELES